LTCLTELAVAVSPSRTLSSAMLACCSEAKTHLARRVLTARIFGLARHRKDSARTFMTGGRSMPVPFRVHGPGCWWEAWGPHEDERGSKDSTPSPFLKRLQPGQIGPVYNLLPTRTPTPPTPNTGPSRPPQSTLPPIFATVACGGCLLRDKNDEHDETTTPNSAPPSHHPARKPRLRAATRPPPRALTPAHIVACR